MLKGKKILIGITGSIAAYKIPFLIRLLKKEGAEVQILMTPYSKEFVTPLTLATLSENAVLHEFHKRDDGSWFSHVDLGLWADLFLLAPLTANTMAKVAYGIADNLLLTTVLSARCPIFFAPAMDLDMYHHPNTQENIKKLETIGYKLIQPVEGELASGLKGMGRLEEPEVIFGIIKNFFEKKKPLNNKKVLVNAGPTYEAIDPVRFIGNYSSGKMGVAIADALADLGAQVDLVLGPSNERPINQEVNIRHITSAEEMYDYCSELFPKVDIAVLSAAVADFTPMVKASNKIKKEGGMDSIELKPTKDILASLGSMKKKNQILVGFALETDNEKQNALKKLKSKNLDLIVLNSLKDQGAGFGHKTNKITIINNKEESFEFPLKEKSEAAYDVAEAILKL
ncbi:MAG: bifunctional phosphopantothenoylcysteine decarboxylase/phosphopantothenate--cysteine ligase CoaBC [Marinilabiliales bacterium]|nr:MAG: bifunctional phosphopantothenoylcysteine decarboxylase/phosphopantothenate--cysteine ligase CoaBC [Marinilabiliales bacterium]